jgi:hypothetical protein
MLLKFCRRAQAETRVCGRLIDVKHYKPALSGAYIIELRRTAMFALLTAKNLKR